jgi:ribonucleotide reductase beta subunit family protein with ferritin-like domain
MSTTPYAVSINKGSVSYDNYVNAPITGPLSTNQYPCAIPYHSYGTLTGIRPTPPQFYPSQEPVYAEMNTNMRQQYLRTAQSKESLAYLIFAAGIIEGLFFSGAFASIFWLKMMRGKNRLFMEGLVKSNKLISRDEGMHTNSDAAMYQFVTPIPKEHAQEMITEAVSLVDKFHRDGIKVDMIGMNIRMMDDYIRYVADRLLVLFGYEKIFQTTNFK